MPPPKSISARDCILTTYPLSRTFREKLDRLLGAEVLNLTLTELRNRPIAKMLAYLRSITADRIFLPIEDENGLAVLPALKLLASIIRAREIYQIAPDMMPKRVTRRESASSVISLVSASAAGYMAVRAARKETSALLSAPRVAVPRAEHPSILFLNANLWFGVKAGGSVGHISGVVNALLKESYPVTFASAGGRLLTDEAAQYVPLRPPANFGLPWEFNIYRYHFNVVEQVKELARRQPVGLIYQRLSVANYSGVILSRMLKVPLIMEYNGSEAWVARNWGRALREQALAERTEDLCLRHAHMVVTISDVLRDELLERGIPGDRILTYPNCIDPETFDPARFSPADIAALRREHGIPSDALVITFLGTFGQWHGAEVLAAAIAALLQEDPGWVRQAKAHFLFVGDGHKMASVRAVLGDHVRGGHVTFTGLVAQKEGPLYLASSDILVSPHVANADGSRFFGSPTKLYEYMAMGKAILASDLDQIGDVLAGSPRVGADPAGSTSDGNGHLALLCEPGNVAQLAEGLKMLAASPSWRERLGANARRRALGRYTWGHHVRAIIERAQALELVSPPQP